MKTRRLLAALLATSAFGIAAACGGGDGGSEDSGAAMQSAPATNEPRVIITSPAENDTVDAGPVTITMGVEGAKIVPANNTRVEGEGHLHIFLDRAVTLPDVPIPMDPTIVHLGNGATEWVLTVTAPGEHTVIAVFAYGDHVPSATVRTDTVKFVVR